MTPAEVRAQIPLVLRNFRTAVLEFVRKKDLVLFNDFVDIPASQGVEQNLNTAVPTGESAKYNLLHSRVNVLIRDDDDESSTYNAYRSVDGEVTFAVKANGRLVLKNNTTAAIRVSVYVSAARK